MTTLENVMMPRVYADFNNVDLQGRVRLIVQGTLDDLKRQSLVLSPGLRLILTDEEVEVEAVVEWSDMESVWVGKLVSGTLRDVSSR